MHFRVTLKIIGMLLMAFSASMLPSLVIALSLHDDGAERAFAISFFITFIAGFLLWLCFAKHNNVLRTRDGFVIVVMFWSILGLFGALPFYFSTPLPPPVLRSLRILMYCLNRYCFTVNFYNGLAVWVLSY